MCNLCYARNYQRIKAIRIKERNIYLKTLTTAELLEVVRNERT